jgi:hypothetical protein
VFFSIRIGRTQLNNPCLNENLLAECSLPVLVRKRIRRYVDKQNEETVPASRFAVARDCWAGFLILRGRAQSVTISVMQQQPLPPQYGPMPQQPMQYGGMPIAQPKKRMNGLLIPFVLTVVFLLAALSFGIWAFMGREDYKANADKKIAAAVVIAQQETSSAKDKEFTEKEKSPLKEYKGPAAYGTLTIQYPKTWSAFVTESDNTGGTPVDGYFHPNFVPGLQSKTDYAMRVKVVSKQYADELKGFESKIKAGKVTVAPFTSSKLPAGVVGSRIDGEINTGQQDSMVLFPLRDKTIEISTESAQFKGDFDSIILANLTFVP